MTRHERFEWDAAKARTNLAKHGIAFQEAVKVLADPFAEAFHVEEPQHRGGEDRWLTWAGHPERRDSVFQVVWTERSSGSGSVTRIISIRKATKQERKGYERKIQNR